MGIIAAEASSLANTMSQGLSTASDNILEMLGVALPIILGVVAAVVAVKFGIKFFKSSAK